MRTIIVTSTSPFAGKTGVCLALARELESRGLDVGYFKSYGTMPIDVGGIVSDRDAVYANGALARPGAIETLCPVVRTRSFMEDLLMGRAGSRMPDLLAAFGAASDGRDVMVVEGPSDLEQGRTAGVSTCDIAGELDAKVLAVDAFGGLALPDALLLAKECLGARLAGVVHNRVHDSERSDLESCVVPYLRRVGIAWFGALPHDPLLSSVSVREIVEELGATVLNAEDRLEEPVESFMVGAMGQEKALRFFRRRAHKAVITGADRPDVQLAALETSTTAIVLTGNMPPDPIVLGRADAQGVPLLLVDMDTLTAVERMDTLLGHVRLHGPGKADRIRAMFTASVDVAGLLSAFDIPAAAPPRQR